VIVEPAGRVDAPLPDVAAAAAQLCLLVGVVVSGDSARRREGGLREGVEAMTSTHTAFRAPSTHRQLQRRRGVVKGVSSRACSRVSTSDDDHHGSEGAVGSLVD